MTTPEGTSTSNTDSSAAAMSMLDSDSSNNTESLSTDGPVDHSSPAVSNPAWTEALRDIPAEYHAKLSPHFQKWDQNYQALQSKYAPWQNADYDRHTALERLANEIDSNPHGFYQRLGQALGITAQQAEDLADNNSDDSDDYDDDSDDSERDPRFAELERVKQTQERMLAYFQEQEHQQEVKAYQAQVNETIGRLKATHEADSSLAGIDFPHKLIVEKVVAQMQRGDNPDPERAYEEIASYIKGVRSASATRSSAPFTVSPTNGGGTPANVFSAEGATREQRRAMAAQMLS